MFGLGLEPADGWDGSHLCLSYTIAVRQAALPKHFVIFLFSHTLHPSAATQRKQTTSPWLQAALADVDDLTVVEEPKTDSGERPRATAQLFVYSK